MRKKWIPLVIAGTLAFVALGGEIVRLLWNWLLPPLFGWPELTFWQALGLLVLCRILFGGLGSHGPRRRSRMHPEVRERIRQSIHEPGGLGPAPGEAGGQ